MPRLSVTTRSVRTRRRGKKWSPVLVPLSTTATVPNDTTNYLSMQHDICANSNNTNLAPTATVIKCGNIKASFDMWKSGTFLGLAEVYIMFKPQGMNIDASYCVSHPEYIMCWRTFDVINDNQSVTMQSRLKRNLNSGDSIIIFIRYKNTQAPGNTTSSLAITGLASYVCCAN